MACWLLTKPDSKDGGEGRIKRNVSEQCFWLPFRTFSDLCPSQAESESLKVGPRNSRNLFLFLFVKLPGGIVQPGLKAWQGMYMESGKMVWMILFAGQQRRH